MDALEPTISALLNSPETTFEQYLERYAHDFYELESGKLVKMSPVHEDHDRISRYLITFFDTYFELRPIGQIRQAPFAMRLLSGQYGREPDIQVILEANYDKLTPTYVNGPADIVIEIVSTESIGRDHDIKFQEYEEAGVNGYWILDPIHKEARFYRIGDDGLYTRQETGQDGNYQTPLLPGLKVHVPTLWHEKLPGPGAISFVQ
jgi:Uma2 family endonuclease